MSKQNKTKGTSGTPDKSTILGNKNLVLAIGVIVVIAVVAVAAYVAMTPGTGSSPAAGNTIITGTGSGAAAGVGNSVSVYYTGTFANGTVFDSNVDKTPLAVKIGAHRVVPGFENALIGMKAGQTKTVTIPVDQAYGTYHPEYVQVVERTGTLATMDLKPGAILTSQDPATGAVTMVTVVNVTRDSVTIDGNSRLAGLPLTFTIQLLSVN
jgi:peptidylprolyl isomerase